MASCEYCGAEVEEEPGNRYTFLSYLRSERRSVYVCPECARTRIVTLEQAQEVLDRWESERSQEA